ncbi:hypothetical protein TREMEDRAFT_30110 [Tremella mesenterica DSM 1558]|uniref:uncharacterized protein n=1 Tax=Tremella mesenterica (strain ATCC 24925 / CBS 8224 / DSM 1558 / NBRC 9311 / NRRL Y-6157 / RJB 2259-6 / UBC 559-6) TaxID=578456 RepID=UPI0003F49178|nr:uncharacterized protein TREMEDRAFT_30110 [Tremella mesenterica DSM 1558]EIW70315.1 hypothetical protein TREMEDRAFT_30110 [Tremella mesenterica DSM 1558]
MTAQLYPTLAITVTISQASLAKLKEQFTTVHYYPIEGDKLFPEHLASEVDVWYSRFSGLPKFITKYEQIPRTKFVQLTSAGANVVLKTPLFQDPEAQKHVSICNASGIHVKSIPQQVIAMIINLYMSLHIQTYLTRSKAAWPSRQEIADAAGKHIESGSNIGSESLIGKRAGMLGYGHIARETARVLKAMNVNIIAANSSGTRRIDDGYIIPGTGDKDGIVPSAYYSTTDPESFREFLSKCDILVASLPSTAETHYILTADLLKQLPDGAVLVNVGRGDLARSEDLLAALDAPGGLSGVALDVTDPEPLTAGHPLYTHPKAIITPHSSGDFVGYFESITDLLVANIKQVRRTGKLMNVVDPVKGY